MGNAPSSSEEKIFIQGPAGQLETMVFGLDNIQELMKNSIKKDDSTLSSISSIKTIGVVCHPHPLHQGTMNNKVVTMICKALQSLGLPTVRFNFRGVGESEGSYDNGIGERLDLEAVLIFLQSRFPNAQFCLAGFSFGSYIALQVAAEPQSFPIQALLSVAPPVHHFAFDKLLLPTCPWVVIQGTEDTIVPYEKVLSWVKILEAKKSNLQFITMDGAEHFFHGKLIELKTLIQDSFRNIL